MFDAVLLLPFDLYPFIGIIISSWLKALSTAHVLHRRVGLICAIPSVGAYLNNSISKPRK